MEIFGLVASIRKQFMYYKVLGDRTFEQLSDQDLFDQFNEQSNSIAVIVNHISGNMLSRWTNFLTEDGEKEWRNRDDEFELNFSSRQEMLKRWEQGWHCLFDALDTINSENINDMVYIRNMGHSIPEATNRQLAHYAYHIGQIVYIGRMLKGEEWKSLSIPKGKSKQYNSEKFNQPKHKEHFTDEFLKKK